MSGATTRARALAAVQADPHVRLSFAVATMDGVLPVTLRAIAELAPGADVLTVGYEAQPGGRRMVATLALLAARRGLWLLPPGGAHPVGVLATRRLWPALAAALPGVLAELEPMSARLGAVLTGKRSRQSDAEILKLAGF